MKSFALLVEDKQLISAFDGEVTLLISCLLCIESKCTWENWGLEGRVGIRGPIWGYVRVSI